MTTPSSFQLRLSGTGGQGLILGGRMLANALVGLGMKVSQSTTYEPTSRGGVSRSDLVVTTDGVDFPLVTGIDYLLILAQSAVGISDGLVKPGGIVVIDGEAITRPPQGEYQLHSLPLMETARRLGNPRVANVIGLGALLALAPVCDFAAVEKVVEASAPAKYRQLNVEALRSGAALARAA